MELLIGFASLGIPLLLALLAAVWWASATHTKVTLLDKKVASIDDKLNEHGIKISRLEVGFEELRSNFDAFRSKFEEKFEEFATKGEFVADQSPLGLTDTGKTVSEAIDAPQIAKKYSDHVPVDKSANPYVIQKTSYDFSISRLMDNLDDDDREKIEMYCYTSGYPMFGILQVIGIEMRDNLLKKFGKIPASEQKTKSVKGTKKGAKGAKKK